jgi:glyoxylase-like metal-dependent hydrolase (beta-lactamase superfamily II)
MAFHQRLLPVFEYTDTKVWIETWDRLVELKAEIVVPGHGEINTMEEVTKHTYDNLKHLRKGISLLPQTLC